MKKINTTNTTATNNMGNGKVKKPFYKNWKFWMVMFAACAICNAGKFNKGVQDGLKANSTQSSVEQTEAKEDISFVVTNVPNDVTGNWRIASITENIEMQDYALDYYKKYFKSDDEIHAIVNFNYKTTTRISVYGNLLDVSVLEYVDKEEHDAKLLFSGKLLEEYHVNKDTGEIEKITLTNTAEVTEEAAAATEEATAEAAEEDNIPEEYKSALKKAQTYSDIMHMSKAGLYNQLTSEYGEQFTEEAAQYAIDNVDADWSANALAKAKDYDGMYMSKAGLFNQLTSEYGEQFTAEEAQYAVDNVNFDWYSNALESAKLYQESMNMSPAAIYDQLTSEYGDKFTTEEADYAIENLDK